MNGLRHVSVLLAGTANPLILAAGTAIAFKAPAAAFGGGVSIEEVYAHVGAGTVTLSVVDLGTTGTVAAGTACNLAISQATQAPFVGTPGAYFLNAGKYCGVVAAAGTVTPALGGARVVIGYRDGRSVA